jgi:hypothetical protein
MGKKIYETRAAPKPVEARPDIIKPAVREAPKPKEPKPKLKSHEHTEEK